MKKPIDQKTGGRSKAGGVPKKETQLSLLVEIRDLLKLLIEVLVETGMVDVPDPKVKPEPVCTQAWQLGDGMVDRSIR